MQARGPNPPNYQEQVKSREFLDFLRSKGILFTKEDVLSRQGSSDDSKAVRDLLHCGVRLLLSNSKKRNRVAARKELEMLLITQAGMYMSNKLEDVMVLGRKIDDHVQVEEKKMAEEKKKPTNNVSSAENLEIDMYLHGWVEEPLTPVREAHCEIMGIQADVIPLHLSPPETRPTMPVWRPQKMTPSAKEDSNVVNVGEAAGTSDDCLPKKVAQLERALTYARYRAGKEDIEQVVGYGALCMSMTDGSSLASAMIGLHPDIFPLLSRMNKKGGLAYLLSRRSVFDDVQNAMEHYGSLNQELKDLKEHYGGLKQDLKDLKWMSCLSLGMSCLSLGMCGLAVISAALWTRRFSQR